MEIPSVVFDPIVTITGMSLYIVFLVLLSRAMDLFMLWVTGIGVLVFGAVLVRTIIAFTGSMPFSPPI